jgi:hypothetical protein
METENPLKKIDTLEFLELVLLYIKAKDKRIHFWSLPYNIVDLIYSLDDAINDFTKEGRKKRPSLYPKAKLKTKNQTTLENYLWEMIDELNEEERDYILGILGFTGLIVDRLTNNNLTGSFLNALEDTIHQYRCGHPLSESDKRFL